MIRITTILLTMIYMIAAASMIFPVTVMADVVNTSKATEDDYNACRQVLRSIIDGYDHNDAAAVKALYYCKPGTDPKTVDTLEVILELGVADYRLTSAASSRFGIHGAMIRTGIETDPATFLGVLSRITQQNAESSGNTLTITPPATVNSAPWPIHFVNAQGWKLDWPRTVRVTVHAMHRKLIAGETAQQGFAAATHLLVGHFNSIADDIDKRNIPDETEAQRRITAAWEDMNSQFRDFWVRSTKPL
jgi:hypothetical protein